MVVFTCGNCGEALKKNQVEKHYASRCRNCNVLSCIDCGKDFWGSDYQQHTKCISEEEKYSGKNYVPKPNANKGEAKQQDWIQKVQSAIEKAQANPSLRNVLERMKEYPNIPRKKAKFENFLGNSLRVHNPKLRDQLWDILMTNTSTDMNKETKMLHNNQTNGNSQSESAEPVSKTGTSDTHPTVQSENSDVRKLNKRERKEERRKGKHKKEKKDQLSNGEPGESMVEKRHKKKRKHEEIEEEEEEGAMDEPNDTNKSQPEGDGEEVSDIEEEPPKKKHKTKFDWESVIMQVLKSKGAEMAVKKVRKKVLAEYLAQGCTAKSEEKLWAKFDKKLKKNPNFKVLKEKVKLVTH